MSKLSHYSINIGPVNACNVKCSFCAFTGTHKPVAVAEKLDFDALRRFLLTDDLAQFPVNRIFLSGLGEILLYEKVYELAQTVAKIVPDTIFFSNALVLNEDASERLLRSGVTQFAISATGFTGSVYSLMQGAGNSAETADKMLNRIKNNIVNLCMLRDKINPKVTVTMNYVLTGDTKIEIFDYMEYMKDIGVDYVTLVPLSNNKSEEDTNPDLEKRIAELRRNKKPLCGSIGMNMYIDYNGNMYPCCSLVRDDLIIGNIYKDTLKGILYGDKMTHLANELFSGGTDIPVSCEYCLTHFDYISNGEGWI